MVVSGTDAIGEDGIPTNGHSQSGVASQLSQSFKHPPTSQRPPRRRSKSCIASDRTGNNNDLNLDEDDIEIGALFAKLDASLNKGKDENQGIADGCLGGMEGNPNFRGPIRRHASLPENFTDHATNYVGAGGVPSQRSMSMNHSKAEGDDSEAILFQKLSASLNKGPKNESAYNPLGQYNTNSRHSSLTGNLTQSLALSDIDQDEISGDAAYNPMCQYSTHRRHASMTEVPNQSLSASSNEHHQLSASMTELENKRRRQADELNSSSTSSQSVGGKLRAFSKFLEDRFNKGDDENMPHASGNRSKSFTTESKDKKAHGDRKRLHKSFGSSARDKSSLRDDPLAMSNRYETLDSSADPEAAVENYKDVAESAEAILMDDDFDEDIHNVWRSDRKEKNTCFMKLVALATIVALVVAYVVLTTLSSRDEPNALTQLAWENPSSMPSIAPTGMPTVEAVTVLDAAPEELEGNCSPSNLPGSKSACLESCRMAACCYLNDDSLGTKVDGGFNAINTFAGTFFGKNCFDTSLTTTIGQLNIHRCEGYRPHCDVVFDPWNGGEDGIIRPPPQNLEELCEHHRYREHVVTNIDAGYTVDGDMIPSRNLFAFDESVGMNSFGLTRSSLIASRSSGSDSLEDYSLKRNKHRNKKRSLNDERGEFCLQACLPSKCCQVEQDDAVSSSQEFPASNCVANNQQSCDAYADHCHEEYKVMFNWETPVPTSPPTVSPIAAPSVSPSTAPTEEPTASPSAKPSIKSSSLPSLSSSALPSSSKSEIPSVTTTYYPSEIPSTTPTKTAFSLPIAPLAKINAACNAPDSLKLILGGDINARKECADACSNGMCCYADTPGMEIQDIVRNGFDSESCFEGNEDVCAGYSGCLTLALSVEDDISDEVSQDSQGSPPYPTQDLSILCSVESRATPSGMMECFKECQEGSCCGGMPATTGDESDESNVSLESCFDENEEVCALYGPCQALADAYGGDGGPNSPLPPLPPNNLPVICSFDTLMRKKDSSENDTFDDSECASVCAAASCCLNNSCPDVAVDSAAAVEDTMEGRCALYDPCRNLEELPMPPGDISDQCQNNSSLSSSKSEQCKSLCEVASCCFSDSATDNSNPQDDRSKESCFALYEDACVKYAPYCSPPKSSDLINTEISSPPPYLASVCSLSNRDEQACKDTCEAAACCFASQTVDSCFSDNEIVCGEWSVCASHFVADDAEFAD